MTTIQPAALPSDVSPMETGVRSLGARLEAWLERIGDRLNPILVKEARQAMKSRHFSVTFEPLACFWLGVDGDGGHNTNA